VIKKRPDAQPNFREREETILEGNPGFPGHVIPTARRDTSPMRRDVREVIPGKSSFDD